MKYVSFSLFVFLFCNAFCARAQSNIISTSAIAEQVMLGNYNPAIYTASVILNHPDTISRGINARVSPDSIHAYIEILRHIRNRNTGYLISK